MTATERISQELARKERGLLKHDYASPCPECGGVVFEWWDSETCQDCEDDEADTDTEQTTLVTDGGRGNNRSLRIIDGVAVLSSLTALVFALFGPGIFAALWGVFAFGCAILALYTGGESA